MLKASEARKLTEESDAVIKNWLVHISDKVKVAADNGKFELNLTQAYHSWDKFRVSTILRAGSPELTDFQRRLKRELMTNGYGFIIKPYQFEVAGGLGCIDLDSAPEIEKGYHLIITW